jgi:membrane protease YdiL (CAAX protease family)
MNAPVIAQPAPPQAKLIAPIWHTVLFLSALAGLGIWSAHRHGLPQIGETNRAVSYLVTIAFEWLLAALAVWGAWINGITVRELIGGRWSNFGQFLRDLGIGIVFLIGSNIFLIALSAALHISPNPDIAKMLPHSRMESFVWVFVALSAGICEELTIRGYLQKQLKGLFKNATAAILVQGVIFGLGHAYQGAKLAFTIVILGCMLGWLAEWQKNLRPGIVAHFLQDLAGGFLGGHH